MMLYEKLRPGSVSAPRGRTTTPEVVIVEQLTCFEPEKRCPRCGETKPVSEYHRRSNRPSGIQPRCKACQIELALESYYRRRAEKRAEYRALRQDVIDAYGGRCQCCGEGIFEFLAIDHINGGGPADRKASGGGWGFLRKIKGDGYPKDELQVLCHNCNCAKGFYGACPHEEAD